MNADGFFFYLRASDLYLRPIVFSSALSAAQAYSRAVKSYAAIAKARVICDQPFLVAATLRGVNCRRAGVHLNVPERRPQESIPHPSKLPLNSCRLIANRSAILQHPKMRH
jgi:hypothetical protein